MTFTYIEADLRKIIKSYFRDGCNYEVEYLDGSIAKYYCSNELEESRLENLMLKQALERQEKVNVKEMEVYKELSRIAAYLSSIACVLSIEEQKSVFALILGILCISSIKEFREKREMLNELKKYQIYIDIMDRIKEVNESELLKCIEFDNYYQIPLNLGTLDNYSLNDIKRIRKTLPILERKKENSK